MTEENHERGSARNGAFLGHAASLPAMFFAQAERRGDRPFLWRRQKGRWTSLSWKEAADRVHAIASGLIADGVLPGDRIALIAENRPEWLLADCAILSAGAITVPGYVTNTPDDHRHVLENSGAERAIVSTRALSERVLAGAAKTLRWIALMDEPPVDVAGSAGASTEDRSSGPIVPDVPAFSSLAQLESLGRSAPADIRSLVSRIKRGDTSSILHTSGSSGRPKGVVLSHGAVLSNLTGAYDLLEDLGPGPDDVFLSFLPISHAYERTAGQYFPVALGGQIYYVENAAQVAPALAEVRPTWIAAVPRLLEVMHQRMTTEARRAGGLRQKLYERAIEERRSASASRSARTLWTSIEDLFLDRLVRDRVRKRFGGRLKAVISGGAPLSPEIGRVFNRLGIRVLQGYGLTEAGPVVSCNPSDRPKHQTVGVPLPGVEVRLASDGEILVRGELVMSGYWNDPESTRSVLADGWLSTGDIGSIDEDGYLAINERKKDIIKNSGGDMISPQRLEGILSAEPEIGQAAVFGDGRPHPVAILVPDEQFLKSWAEREGRDPGEAGGDPGFRQAVTAAVERANGRLSQPERIRRFLIAQEPFSIGNDLLTPTLKLKRHLIRARYGEQIEQLYRG